MYYLEVGNILHEIHTILHDREDISISFVKKQANKTALARVPCEVGSFNDLSSPPYLVL